MTKDQIIENLERIISVERQEKMLAYQTIDRLNERVSSMEKIIDKLSDSKKTLGKKVKSLSKLNSNKSEVQRPEKEKHPTEESLRESYEKRAKACKERKNNNAKRNTHFELETLYHDAYPNMPFLDATTYEHFKENCFNNGRESTRYEYIPPRFIKHVYRLMSGVWNGRMYDAKAPGTAFLNSNFDASILAGLMQLRYTYSMPVTRITKYFAENGFDMTKATANGLLQKTAGIMENVYKAIRQEILKEDYLSADETYYKILVQDKNSDGKGIKKGYFWVIVGMKSKMVYVKYEKGSRSEKVILKEFENISGTVQSDGYSAYKKMEKDDYPNITRIACLQHIKRKFIDCKNDKDAEKITGLINDLYTNDHEHKIGENNWTVEDNLNWRKKYAPDKLKEIEEELNRISNSSMDLPTSDDLVGAVNYMRKEWNAVENIFLRGDTHLDNNIVERMNRFFSLSRRNSLFFGSHQGAQNGAILYTLAISCKMRGINFYDYMVDIINRTIGWSPNKNLDKYRNLLPDRWEKQG